MKVRLFINFFELLSNKLWFAFNYLFIFDLNLFFFVVYTPTFIQIMIIKKKQFLKTE